MTGLAHTRARDFAEFSNVLAGESLSISPLNYARCRACRCDFSLSIVELKPRLTGPFTQGFAGCFAFVFVPQLQQAESLQ